MADHAPSSSSSGRTKRANERTVGDFIVGSEIGKGSFAQVYMGLHKVSKAVVAIKSVELARLNKKLKENLYGEITILKTLRHPHIVALHDCVESTTHINLVMEYCELGDLSLFIKKRDKHGSNPVTYDMARKYPITPNYGLHEVVIRHFLQQLASALKFLREKNYVHRDVKPQNLLLLPSPSYRKAHAKNILEASSDSLIPVAGVPSFPMLKLADFGFARVLPSTSLADTLCGSPLYMAPEILRYERYDAKADLWSVGTVVYEMITGRPPFRARNHVELLRKIEGSDDTIRFSRDIPLSPEMKSLVRQLLRRNAVERLSFEKFFEHPVVVDPIPGLVEDDVPRPPPAAANPQEPFRGTPPTRHHDLVTDGAQARSPRGTGPSTPRSPTTATSSRTQGVRAEETGGRSAASSSPRGEIATGLGIRDRRFSSSAAAASASARKLAEAASTLLVETPRRSGYGHEDASSPPPDLFNEKANSRPSPREIAEEQERAAQDVAFERDYVVVEKRQVEVNAFADEMAANPRLSSPPQGPRSSPKSGQIVRRGTQSGTSPQSLAAAAQSSRAVQVAQVGKERSGHDRRGSHDKSITGGSPVSTTSAISKAIQDASLRLFGIRVPPPRLSKGHSPPLYSPFPAYPTPTGQTALLGDGRNGGSQDEDARVFQRIEDYANRSECVYGFAEVKYKQLVPITPSVEHGLGGLETNAIDLEEDGLTIDAIVTLSEEALVLYVKALTLLAKAMDIASIWWNGKTQVEQRTTIRDASNSQNLPVRINSAVQWVRQRFNETLEKTEMVRLKLVDAQKRLPSEHPSHPSQQNQVASSLPRSGVEHVFLTPGISAEKLMYDRALDMSRTAAIDEIANEHLADCEAYYLTSIRMLEAVLEGDDDVARVRVSGSKEVGDDGNETSGDLDGDDRRQVARMITMISGRLASVRKKMRMIAELEKTQHGHSHNTWRRSGDTTPYSIRSQSSS